MGFIHNGLYPKQGQKLLSSFYKFPPQSFNEIYQRAENISWKDETLTTGLDNLKWEKHENEDESTRTHEQEDESNSSIENE